MLAGSSIQAADNLSSTGFGRASASYIIFDAHETCVLVRIAWAILCLIFDQLFLIQLGHFAEVPWQFITHGSIIIPHSIGLRYSELIPHETFSQ